VGLSNQCEIPETEHIADREAANFCDSFKPATDDPTPPSQNLKSAAEKLFGSATDDEESPKSSFDDLFG